ncbi:DUF2515 domain-containing protein [Geobacillus stearothermophilus]|nr:DUF2515 domain-containing protein [Geobacillus stearothermophilus]
MRIRSCYCMKKASGEAWPDLTHSFDDRRDWFTDDTIMRALETLPLPASGEMTNHYERHLAMMKAAAIAAAE